MAGNLVKTISSYPDCSFVVKVLVLLIIIFKCSKLRRFSLSEANYPILKSLFRNLAIKDNLSYQSISTLITNYQKSIMEILDILTINVTKFKPPITEWIFAVPLLHFAMKKCKPFGHLEKMSWDFDKVYSDKTRLVC